MATAAAAGYDGVSVAGRRVLAFVVAVLCIAARMALGAGTSSRHEARTLDEPVLVGRVVPQAAVEPVEPEEPEALSGPAHPSLSSALLAPPEPLRAQPSAARLEARRGDPRASRGPPSVVVS